MCLMVKDPSNRPLMPVSQDSGKRTVQRKERGQQGMSLEPCAGLLSVLWYPRKGQLCVGNGPGLCPALQRLQAARGRLGRIPEVNPY